LRYAATDAAVLLPLREGLHGELERAGLLAAAPLEWDCLPAVVEMELSGIGIDQGVCRNSPLRGFGGWSSSVNRCGMKCSPSLEEALQGRRRRVWGSWRMDEPYIKVKGQWRYLYRAVDTHGQTIDFLLTEERDEHAAKRFLTKAIRRHGVLEKIPIDGSAANEAAIKSYNTEHGTAIIIRQVKYLNNVVEQDHR